MNAPVMISARIVETLYSEALVLSDQVRAAFSLSGRIAPGETEEDLARVAHSSEGLRTTTRMMHAVAWLLNHRAFLMGELTEFQLRRYGKLAPDPRQSDPQHLALLDPEVRALVAQTARFHARLRRLDETWRRGAAAHAGAIERLRARIETRVLQQQVG
jgi:regulator of CtrA degradation